MKNKRLEQQLLKDIILRHPKPYMRERASAVLQVHEGSSSRQVALNGLLHQRKPDTVYQWLHRYNDEGFLGLYNRPGRGRKPNYDESQKEQIRKQVRLIILHEHEEFVSAYPR